MILFETDRPNAFMHTGFILWEHKHIKLYKNSWKMGEQKKTSQTECFELMNIIFYQSFTFKIAIGRKIETFLVFMFELK